MKAFGQDLDQIAVWEPGRSLALDDYGCFRRSLGSVVGFLNFLCEAVETCPRRRACSSHQARTRVAVG
jgi:hypothetical protein